VHVPAIEPDATAAVESPLAATSGGHDYEGLFANEGPRLWRALYAYTGGRQDLADEALAEAFARAIGSDARIRDPVAWLYRVAFRLAAGELRRARLGDNQVPEEGADPTETPDLLPALRELSPNQRAAIVLVYEDGLTMAETAHRLGITQATVRVHLHRGRNRLRELLREEVER